MGGHIIVIGYWSHPVWVGNTFNDGMEEHYWLILANIVHYSCIYNIKKTCRILARIYFINRYIKSMFNDNCL